MVRHPLDEADSAAEELGPPTHARDLRGVLDRRDDHRREEPLTAPEYQADWWENSVEPPTMYDHWALGVLPDA